MTDPATSPDPSPQQPAPAPAPLTVYELRRLGADYLWRANLAMEHARHGGAGGNAYVPLAETPEEHAGQYVVSEGSLRRALAALDYQLRNLDPGENGTLWEQARAVLAAAIEHSGGTVPPSPTAP